MKESEKFVVNLRVLIDTWWNVNTCSFHPAHETYPF